MRRRIIGVMVRVGVRVLELGSLGKGESCSEGCWGEGVVLRELG